MIVKEIDRQTWQQRHPEGTDQDWHDFVAAGKHSSFMNMHSALRKINWVLCRSDSDQVETTFEAAVEALLKVIQRQQEYVRKHTRWLVKALEWKQNQKRSEFLLIGEERQQAENWLKTRFINQQAPCIPTDLHCEFIAESLRNADNLMTQVFLAYAEADKAVMEEIQRFLWRQGITVWINPSSLQISKDGLKTIERGIEETDNLIYLLSPAALTSSYCQHALTYGLGLHKRIIPILVSPLGDQPRPPELADLPVMELSQTQAIGLDLTQTELLKMLKQDEAYHREHTLLLTKALKWQRQNQNSSILLRGYDLRRSEAWLKVAQKRNHQAPTALQIAFLEASLNRPEEAGAIGALAVSSRS